MFSWCKGLWKLISIKKNKKEENVIKCVSYEFQSYIIMTLNLWEKIYNFFLLF